MRKKSENRKIFIILLILLVPVALLFLSWLILMLPVTQRYILRFAEDQIERVLIGDCSIGSLSTNFLTYAEVRNISLRDPDGHGDSIVIGRVRAKFSVLSLLKKKVNVHNVLIDNIDALLTVTPEGRLMIPALPDSLFIDSLTQNDDSIKITAPSDWVVCISKARAVHINAIYSDSLLNFVGRIHDAVAEAEIFNYDSMHLHLAVKAGFYESPWWSGNIDTIGSSGVLTLKGLVFSDILVDGSTTNVIGKGQIPFSDTGYWDLSAEFKSDLDPVKAVYKNIPTLTSQGSVKGIASWKGTLAHPVLHGRAAGTDWKTTMLHIPSFYTEITYDGDSLVKAHNVLVTDIGRAVCSSTISMPSLFLRPSINEYQAECFASGLDLSGVGIPDSLQRYFPWNRGQASVKINGAGIEKLPDTIKVQTALQSSDTGTGDAHVKANLNGDLWDVNIAWKNNNLSGKGNVSKHGALSGLVNGDLGDITMVSSLFFPERIKGAIALNGNLNGTLSNPEFFLEISSHSLSWNSVTADSLFVNIDIKKNDVKLHPSFISIEADVDSATPYFGIYGISGTFFLDAMISGDILKPNVSCVSTMKKVYYSKWTADSIDAEFSVVNLDSIDMKQLRIFRNKACLSGNGTAVLNSRMLKFDLTPSLLYEKTWVEKGSLHIDGKIGSDSLMWGIMVDTFDVASVNEWIPLTDSLAGICSIRAQVIGKSQNPEGFLDFKIQRPAYNEMNVKEINGKIQLEDYALSGNVVAKITDSIKPIILNLNLPLSYNNVFSIDMAANRSAKITLKGREISATELIKIFGSDWNSDGILQCDIELGKKNGEWLLDGDATFQSNMTSNSSENIWFSKGYVLGSISGTLEKPRINYIITTDKVMVAGAIIDSSFLNGTVNSDTVKCDTGRISLSDNGLLEISGTLPLNNKDSLLLQPGMNVDFAVVKFPLRLLSPFLPENMIRDGAAHGKGTIQISNGRPILNGKVYIDKAKIAVEDIEPVIGPVSLVIKMSNDSLIIESLKGNWGKGSINGSGVTIWSTQGLSEFNIMTEGKNISFEMVDIFNVNIPEMKSSITKQDKRFIVKGDIDLGPTRFFRDIRITDFINDNNGMEYVEVKSDSLLENIDLQLHLRFLESPVVDMNLGYFELGGNISITGTAKNPSYIGEVTIEDGYVLYFDRQFEVTEGSFVNYEPLRFNPILKLKARTEVFATSAGTENVENFTIYLDVSGTLENPLVKLSDESGMLKEADIISILTLGQRLGSIGEDLGDRLRAFAGQSILGFGTRQLEQVLKMDRIDIQGDIFKIGSKDKDKKDPNIPILTLSKRISPRLIVSYETAIGDLTRRKITALFRLTKWLFVKGNADSDDYGLDLIFKYSR